MPRDSKHSPSDQQELGSGSTSGAAPEAANSVGGPGVDVLLSRNGRSSPLGKFDDELSRCPINSETKARAAVIAASHGMSLTEWQRTLIECATWGANQVANWNAERIRRVGDLLGGKVGDTE